MKYKPLPVIHEVPSLSCSPDRTPSVAFSSVRMSSDVTCEEMNTDETLPLTGIRSRTTQPKKTQTPMDETCFIDREIGPGDTLQSMALKYGCKVADLKVANNLIKDQDFFGLRILRVPARQHGLLTELYGPQLRETALNGSSSGTAQQGRIPFTSSAAEEQFSGEDGVSDDATETDSLVRTVSINDNLKSQTKQAVQFLHQMDRDIRKIVSNTKQKSRRTSDSRRPYLSQSRFIPVPSRQTNSHDYGITWWKLLIVVLVVALVTPTLYILYYDYIKKSKEIRP